MKKTLTLVFLVEEERICLAMKKRGFGAGKWNGYGGKLEPGETIREAAVREVREESGVEVQESDLTEAAVHNFMFADGTHFEVHAFLTRVWEGEPQETEEMRPAWYAINDLPYESMWADDPHWLPRVLRGEKLRGTVWFDVTGENIERMEWEAASGFS